MIFYNLYVLSDSALRIYYTPIKRRLNQEDKKEKEEHFSLSKEGNKTSSSNDKQQTIKSTLINEPTDTPMTNQRKTKGIVIFSICKNINQQSDARQIKTNEISKKYHKTFRVIYTALDPKSDKFKGMYYRYVKNDCRCSQFIFTFLLFYTTN